MRGPHVFAGYHRDPEARRPRSRTAGCTRATSATLDADGFLRITGRKKDLIITSSGKNISPELIESALRETRWISQAVVVGDRRPTSSRCHARPGRAAAADGEVRPRSRPGVSARTCGCASRLARHRDRQPRLAQIEQIKRFAILPRDFSQPTAS